MKKDNVLEKVTSIKKLREITKKKYVNFRLLLNGGLFSKKTIRFDEEEMKFYIYNHIDDSVQIIGLHQILNEEYTNIGKAIKMGSFFRER